jgi:hypothetical protein
MDKIEMIPIVIDTNVYLSALLFAGTPGKLIPLCMSRFYRFVMLFRPNPVLTSLPKILQMIFFCIVAKLPAQERSLAAITISLH